MAKVYNVWREDRNRWAAVITPHGHNDPNPRPLTYIQAREVVEYMRQGSLGYEVRELLSNGESGGVAVGYNVWMINYSRWTMMPYAAVVDLANVVRDQDPKAPEPLSLVQAQQLRQLLINRKVSDCAPELMEVMEIDSSVSFCRIHGAPASQPMAKQETVAETTSHREPEMNWAVYCGFQKTPPKSIAQQLAKIDPYTGLRIK